MLVKIAYLVLNDFEYDTRARLEVETLLGAGHRVDVIAATGAITDSFQNARIHRVPQWRGPTRKFRFVQYNLLAASIGARIRADVYHAVDLDALLAAYWASCQRGAPIVYEARELYTELEPLTGRKAAARTWELLERRLIGRAARVITINESIAEELCRRYGIVRPEIIRNVAPLPGPITPIDLRSKFDIPRDWKVIIYQGVLRPGQGLNYAVEIMRCLDKMALIFIGDGVIKSELEESVSRSGIADRVKFGGRVPPADLLPYTAGADAGLLLMEDVALNNRLALPQKLFQYLVAGIPQIVSPMPEIAAFVKGEGTGIVVPPADPEAAACDVASFLSNDAALDRACENCRHSAARNNWGLESRKLVEIYEGLTNR
jgi:glycosyltransferase involved in cell wall biosynthesis